MPALTKLMIRVQAQRPQKLTILLVQQGRPPKAMEIEKRSQASRTCQVTVQFRAKG